MLTTIEKVKQHLRVDSDADTAYIKDLAQAASAWARGYLDGGDPYVVARNSDGTPQLEEGGQVVHQEDADGNLLVKPDVEQAVLLMVGDFYNTRENVKGEIEFGADKAPVYVASLLYPHRRNNGV